VPVKSIINLYTYPQFYNVVDDSGNMIGKLLARFYLHESKNDKFDDNEKKIRDLLL